MAPTEPPGAEVDRTGAGVDPRAVHAVRALRAYVAMQAEFRRPSEVYRRDGRLGRLGVAAHLWPFARAFVATLDLAGIDPGLLPGFDAGAAIAADLRVLERYWDVRGPLPAYASDRPGTPFGGDRYYDDNAWVGLALVQLGRLRAGESRLDRAAQLYRFALGGWNQRHAAPPGGVFWVEQGRGTGRRNRDRNTVSNAPNAALGLHLAELRAGPDGDCVTAGPVTAEQMYGWVLANLDAGGDPGHPGTGLFWDKLRGDGTIDRGLWSYNQGSMIGAGVLLARRGGDRRAEHLARAEGTARLALEHYAAGGLLRQPPAFNAILFRNLLLLSAATGDAGLRDQIIGALRAYADEIWERARDELDRFRFGRDGITLLGQSAVVSVLALLAWSPSAYPKLA